jgi:hypothetical protein
MSMARVKITALVLLASAITTSTVAIPYYTLATRPTQPGEQELPGDAMAVSRAGWTSGDPAVPARADADRPPQPANLSRPPLNPGVTEVAVVATQHFITDMPDGFTPGHLRLLLTRLSPDLLAVDAPTNVAGPWEFAPYELARVTKPWADGRRVSVLPVGWHEPGYQAQVEAMLGDFRARGQWAVYENAERSFQARAAEQAATCQFMNSHAGHRLWREYHAALHALYGRETPWELWHGKILANVLRVCRENRGKRVAVVMGGAHAYYLLDGLAKEKRVRLIRVEQFFPLAAEAVAARTTPADHLQALRLLNFPAVAPDRLGTLERHLERIRDVPELLGDYHLFRGKLLLHRGQAGAAVEEFGTLSRLDRQAVSAFDGQSRLQEAGRVYAAIAKQRAGDLAGARSDLNALLGEPAVTRSSKKWAEGILAGIPPPQ